MLDMGEVSLVNVADRRRRLRGHAHRIDARDLQGDEGSLRVLESILGRPLDQRSQAGEFLSPGDFVLVQDPKVPEWHGEGEFFAAPGWFSDPGVQLDASRKLSYATAPSFEPKVLYALRATYGTPSPAASDDGHTQPHPTSADLPSVHQAKAFAAAQPLLEEIRAEIQRIHRSEDPGGVGIGLLRLLRDQVDGLLQEIDALVAPTPTPRPGWRARVRARFAMLGAAGRVIRTVDASSRLYLLLERLGGVFPPASNPMDWL